jgi:hypothetical protein
VALTKRICKFDLKRHFQEGVISCPFPYKKQPRTIGENKFSSQMGWLLFEGSDPEMSKIFFPIIPF